MSYDSTAEALAAINAEPRDLLTAEDVIVRGQTGALVVLRRKSSVHHRALRTLAHGRRDGRALDADLDCLAEACNAFARGSLTSARTAP